MVSMVEPSQHNLALPDGSQLAEYRIERVLGVSGYGISYLAVDPARPGQVAIEEYLPNDIARRQGTSVRPRSLAHDGEFRRGREQFLASARALLDIRHPSLVPALGIFEAHNTAYFVSEHEVGERLDVALARRERDFEEAELRRLVLALIDALEALGAVTPVHGGIEPGCIQLRPDGTPVLMNLAVSRAAAGPKGRHLAIGLAPGYAAIEQYTGRAALGPHTDVYALGALLYRIVTGRDPLDAPARVLEDEQVPSSRLALGRYSRKMLRAIDTALAVRPEDRPQTLGEWREMLAAPPVTERVAPAAAAAAKGENPGEGKVAAGEDLRAERDEDPDWEPSGGFWYDIDWGRYIPYGVGAAASAGVIALVIAAVGSERYYAELSVGRQASERLMQERLMEADRILADLPPGSGDESNAATAPPVDVQSDIAALERRQAEARAAEEQRQREVAAQRERQQAEGRAAEEQRQREAAAQRERQQAEARAAEERRQAEARAAEERRQREVAAQQERQRQQAETRAAEERRQAEARAAEERRQREAAAQQERERQQAEARAAEERRQREAAAQQQRERQQAEARAAEERRQREVAAQQERERQQAEARAAEERRQREIAAQQERERQQAEARVAEEQRQRELALQRERQQAEARAAAMSPPPEQRAREAAEARQREFASAAAAPAPGGAPTTGRLLGTIGPAAGTAAPAAREPAAAPSIAAAPAAPVTPAPAGQAGIPLRAEPPATEAPAAVPGSRIASATGAPLRLSPPSIVEPSRATAVPAQPAPRRSTPVALPPAGRQTEIGAVADVNVGWGYVVLQVDPGTVRPGDRIYARSGIEKLWMTVRRVNGTQVSATTDVDLRRFTSDLRVYKD